MQYYKYNTLEIGQEASASIYDLNAPAQAIEEGYLIND
jgi:hypothetical protein